MKIDQIKKDARNLQKHLPAFTSNHQPPYSLTALQQLACQIRGYPNMEVASAACKRSDDEDQDPLVGFYNYPWHKIDPHTLMASMQGRQDRRFAERFNLTVGDVAKAHEWVRKLAKRQADSTAEPITAVAVIAIGKQSADLEMALFNPEDDNGMAIFGSFMQSDSFRFHQGAGGAVNWLAAWAHDDIKRALQAMVQPACSSQQFEMCKMVIEVVVDRLTEAYTDAGPWFSHDAPARITAAQLYERVRALVSISQGGLYQDQATELFIEFGAKGFDAGTAYTVAHSHRDDLLEQVVTPALESMVRPLTCLLARLATSEASSRHNSTLGHTEPYNSMDFAGGHNVLTTVSINMGGRNLDHVFAMAVLSKLAATMRSDPFWSGDIIFRETANKPPVEVLLVVS